MNILFALLLSLLLFFGGKPAEERVLAYIEIVQTSDGIYIRTTYDSRVFINECMPKHVVAKEFLKTCVEDTTDTKTKKL